MEQITLEASKRTQITKGETHRLRLKGFVPVVLYGGEEKPETIYVNEKDFSQLLKSAAGSKIISLKIGDTLCPAILKEVQRNIISRKPIHADFQRVVMTRKLEITVPVRLEGDAVGIKSGGIVEHILREVKVKCLPDNIPQAITVNVTNLGIGDAVMVKSLELGSNVEILTTSDQIIVHVVAPKVEEVAATPEVIAAAPGATPAQPEVIATKGKKEEEAAEGEKAAPAKQPAK